MNNKMAEISKNGKITIVARKNNVVGKAQMPEVLCGVLTNRKYILI
jgi:hypothetical protein